MVAEPDFLETDNRSQPVADDVFRPASASRQSEALAWAAAISFALLALAGLLRGTGPVPFSAELASFFGVASLWISLGNWIDRRTAIEVSDAGIRYRSPLRNLSLGWADIDGLWAIPSGSSWRIVVRGPGARFGFRTSSELRVGQGSLQVGYPHGERLGGLICRRASLSQPVGSNGEWICTRRTGISE